MDARGRALCCGPLDRDGPTGSRRRRRGRTGASLRSAWGLAVAGLFALVALTVLASPAAAADGQVEIAAREDECGDGREVCFDPATAEAPSGTVEITLDNTRTTAPHDLCLDVNGSIRCVAGRSDGLPAGEQASMMVTLEASSDYTFWSDEGDDRADGMEGVLHVRGTESGSPDVEVLHVQALEGRKCSGGKAACFGPSWARVRPGTLRIVLENPEGYEPEEKEGHDLCLDVGGTVRCVAGRNDTVAPGTQANVTVTLETAGNYTFWSDEADDRADGMEGVIWVTMQESDMGHTLGSDDGPGEDGEKAGGRPLPGFEGLIAILVGGSVAWVKRGRGD